MMAPVPASTSQTGVEGLHQRDAQHVPEMVSGKATTT